MSVTQYIGARYVPIFAEPDQWSSDRAYEPLTIVLHEGNSYTSKQAVPIGIDILNTEFWACTGNYNAQVEAYRREVQEFADDIEAVQATADEAKEAVELETTARETADANLQAAIDAEAAARETTDANLQAAIDAEAAAREAADNEILQSIGENVLVWIGDSWSTYKDAYIPNKVAQSISATLKNYAVSGMGFLEGAQNFTWQVEQAIADTTIENPNNVKHIVMYGLSNDWSHDFRNASQFLSPISNAVAALKTKFKNATVHIFFNNRFKYGNTVYRSQTPQIKLVNNIYNTLLRNNVEAVIHPDSVTWLGPDSFVEDMVHPNDSFGYQYLAQYITTCLTGGVVDAFYTNISSVALSGDKLTSGQIQVLYDNRTVTFMCYANLNANFDTAAVVARGRGLFPVDLWESPSVGQASNQCACIAGRSNGSGEIKFAMQFDQNANEEDLVYLQNLHAEEVNTPAGPYYGSTTFRFF